MTPATRAEVRTGTIRIASAPIGAVDPLPPVIGRADLHEKIPSDGLDAEMARGTAYGKVPTVLPYLLQNGYGRDLDPCEHPTAVLENDAVRAVFLTGLGGRLWSLTDKRSGRELLHSPAQLRIGNLGLRNAWFAGGVEWNLGTTGHWPLTCAPLHVARVERGDGAAGVRLYEYERMRGLVVRIDASLPPGTALLAVRITIVNPNEHEVPVYWWSNIAVPEHPDVRVVAPAASAWRFGYTRTLDRVGFPVVDGVDRSRTTRAAAASDFFFDLDDPAGSGRPAVPWIAALDGDGDGLFQASTRRMRGRKLFHWGTGPGGSHWQEWLGDDTARYLEIQAGLARTQLEHLPMPAGARWSWTEVYGVAHADADAVHGPAWDRAVDAAGEAVLAAGAAAVLASEDARDDRDDRIVDLPARASGWGALEDARRRSSGAPGISTAATPFPASDLGAEQAYWLALLPDAGARAVGAVGVDTADAAGTDAADASVAAAGSGVADGPGASAIATAVGARHGPDEQNVAAGPLSYQADPDWLPLLASCRDWLALLHRGVLHAAAGDHAAAKQAWRDSAAASDNGWARRNLARVAAADGDHAVAAAEYARARALLPELPSLAVEVVAHLVDAGRDAEALREIDGLPPALRATGRIRFAEARAALAVGDLARCGSILESGIEIPDLREGEISLDRLWLDYQAHRLARAEGTAVTDALRLRAEAEHPVPRRYDFRMHAPVRTPRP